MSELYQIFHPLRSVCPIVLSIPHAGTQLPAHLIAAYRPGMLPPDDTDWWVDQLYDFAPSMGITVISAQYSRWLIDLNRNPDSQPLYTDGRLITELCTTTNFVGEPIYADLRTALPEAIIAERKTRYFEPYHQKVQELLNVVKARCGNVLLWDCHSIRRQVPTISTVPFPDMILGSADETSADIRIINEALQLLRSGNYRVSHNHPFKGGYITRHFGKPHQQQHALQLEMAKDLYMDDTETLYDDRRAAAVQELLKRTLGNLAELISKL